MAGDPPSGASAPDQVDAFAAWLFRQECLFVRGVTRIGDLPPETLPEVAFAGRSNVGKSSLLNALTGRRNLARTSNTPGRTQQLNFFDLGGRLMLVDLPGYGYAKAPRKQVKSWTELIHAYLKGRPNLRRVCLLIDARHGLKEADESLLNELDAAAVPCQAILTKRDKVKAGGFEAMMEKLRADLARHVVCHPEVIVTSAEKGTGIDALRRSLAALADAG